MTRESRSIALLPRIHKRISATFVAGALAMLTNSVVAQEELAFFNLTDVYGLFSVRYLMDSAQNEGVAGTSKAASSRLAEELKIVTKAYVYHPAFLNMTISGSPIFVQNDYDSDSGESKLRETLFGYNASFNFLNRKRYPFSIWFGRAHPEVSTGLSGRYRTVTNSYGIRGRLLMPVQLSWRFSHQDAKGSGFDATVDSDTDNASLRATFPYGRKNNLTLALNWTELDSRSGSPGLPIQPTNTETFSSELSELKARLESRESTLLDTEKMLDDVIAERDRLQADLTERGRELTQAQAAMTAAQSEMATGEAVEVGAVEVAALQIANPDADEDGVPDSVDLCLETQQGIAVESTGCAAGAAISLEGVNFRYNSHELTDDAQRILDRVADTLSRHSDLRLQVAGHTDSQGDAAYNQWLSLQRAQTVRDYLVAQGVNPDHIGAAGYGGEQPIADNTTKEGLRMNRRVELRNLQ